jgi:cytochrome bd ubiquinol oxidase subunit II
MLAHFWFIVIAVLWAGFFILEGFDFGVAMLLPVIAPPGAGRDSAALEADRRAVLATIGPVWDGNEVWLITAGGAMFAAFPDWYASLFSGLYLALFAVLLALIVRGVSLEYRGKVATARARAWCDRGIVAGGVLPALLFGVAFGNIVRGLAMTTDHQVTAGFLDLLNPYAVLGGLTTVALFALHGAVFLALKTAGRLRARARRVTSLLAGPSLAVLGGFLAWTVDLRGGVWAGAVAAGAVAALAAAILAWRARRDGWAFLATSAATGLLVAAWFVALYPDVLPARGGGAGAGLTIKNASSAHYTLTVMTVVALAVTPVVLAYQAWSYWVFRRRLFGADRPTSAGGAGPVGGAGPAGEAVVSR